MPLWVLIVTIPLVLAAAVITWRVCVEASRHDYVARTDPFERALDSAGLRPGAVPIRKEPPAPVAPVRRRPWPPRV